MSDIVIGAKVINKAGETGTIVSIADTFFTVDYATRVAKLQLDAFEKRFVRYENTDLQSKVDDGIRQIKEAKEQEAEAKIVADNKAKEECAKMEALAPVGVKFNSVSIRLEPAPASFNSVKNKHRNLVREIFDECDKDISAYYDIFHPTMQYIAPRYSYSSTFTGNLRSRYCTGFLTKYDNAYVFRVISRNDVYKPGMMGGFTVTNSDITEILRIVCVDGEVYSFSKHLSCAGGIYKNTTSYKKWQASDFACFVNLDEVIRKCDCNYLNSYIETEKVNCLCYVKLLMSALNDNKAEIVFKNRLFSAVANIDNITDYLSGFSSKQIDFASKNNVFNALPIIKSSGIFDLDILENVEALMRKGRNTSSVYDNLVEIFEKRNFDRSVLDKKIIGFLKKTELDEPFNAAVYGDYIRELVNYPIVTIEDVFDRDYFDRHYAMMLEKDVFYSYETISQYAQMAQELEWINREDNGYYIIVPQTIPEFRYEGQAQHNCVYTNMYFEKVINRNSIIVFLRKEKSEPYVTIEFDYETFDVRQALGKYNRRIDRDLYNYIVNLGKQLNYERLSQD